MWKKQIETFRNVAFCFAYWQNLSMDKKTAQKIALKIATDLEGPLGRISMGRVVRKHIAFFNELRSEGASWPQIADLLAGAGVTRKDGKQMAASQLRATVSRMNVKKSMTSQNPKRVSEKTASNPSKKMPDALKKSKNVAQKLFSNRDIRSIRDKMNLAKTARKQ